MDASDYAIGTSLQQIQPIQVKDLKGTPVYDCLLRAYKAKFPIPLLFIKLVKDIDKREGGKDQWVENFKDMTVHMEQVITYWSHTLKPAE